MKPAPLCRHCGKPIRKKTETIFFTQKDKGLSYGVQVETLPQTKAEAQKYTNAQIVSVRRSKKMNWATGEKEDQGISWVSTWDGESYVDDFFCNDDHAKRFGYVFARAGYQTKAYAAAVEKASKSKGLTST